LGLSRRTCLWREQTRSASGTCRYGSAKRAPPRRSRAIGRAPIQRARDRRARRPFGADFRFDGRTGSGKNVPSGNSSYRLNTCTWPSPPRLPSITNLVPTGNRLGRRPEPYAMATSCNIVILTLQCVGQLIRCMAQFVIHAIPSREPAMRAAGPPRRRRTDVIGKSRRTRVSTVFRP
jgi:hypothetical protein